MNVYHGSYVAIYDIDLSKGEPKKDFGRGFYVTKLRSQAEFWAVRKGVRKRSDCIITEFEFDEDAYDDSNVNVLRFEDYNDAWFDFVIQNRKTKKPTHNYDIIEGPVADDKIQNRIVRFLNNEITREEFFEQLTYPEPSHQICFSTVNSLQYLKRSTHNIVFNLEDIGEKIVENLIIDYGKSEKKASELFFSSETFGKLADISTNFYRKPWQEIYEMLKKEL
ncbi:hypothetical protein FACS189429_8310 [Bacteroidia bacterium]|nr:hypothetical protein FACS189429_8310 [Bacteroidia bacterium]GHV44829.1 hypothetical protein FACS1894180_6650 [Bacteroidia bacterium]